MTDSTKTNSDGSTPSVSRRGLLSAGGAVLAGVAALGDSTDALTTAPSSSSGTRINDWLSAEQVVTPADVDVGFTEHHPKEPAAFRHEGRYFIAAAVWDAYDPSNLTDKEVVILTSDAPGGNFTQVSRVTSNAGTFMHAPCPIVDESGELWVFYSDKSGGSNDIAVKHAPALDLPSDPGGWTDEGVVISNARDPGLIRSGDGTYYAFYTHDSNNTIYRQEGTDLVSWSGATEVYTEANNQAADVIPKVGGGYWLTVTAYNGSSYHAVAGESSSLTGSFTGRTPICQVGALNGVQKSWYSEWTTHFGYPRGNTGKDLITADGDAFAYFEGGDGSSFSIGIAVSDTSGDGNPGC